MKKLFKNLSFLQEKNSAFAPLPTEQMKNVFGGTQENEGDFETMGSGTRGTSCCHADTNGVRRCFVSCCKPEPIPASL